MPACKWTRAARGGNLEGATRTFEQLLAYANDVGLFAEEVDPGTGAALGNFPPMPARPAMYPRMASEQDGPTPTKQLEPRGFMAFNYGRRTPISVIVAHLVYGGILGAFYRLK